MAFGFSGSTEKSQMIGADVMIAHYDGIRGIASDYNITAKSPVNKSKLFLSTQNLNYIFVQCSKVLGRYKGVCKDLVVGGNDDVQYHTASRVDGINVITFRRSLISGILFYSFSAFRLLNCYFIFQVTMVIRRSLVKIVVQFT